jgi:formyltetrahydrofolate synthetase
MQGKIESIAKNIYGAGSVEYSAAAEAALEQYTRQGFADLPVCMAKTQYSFS